MASSCKLVGASSLQDTGHDDFAAEVVSAFSEAFNNIAIHGYADTEPGDISIEIETSAEAITIRIADTGRTFERVSAFAPRPERLPESGMGLFIIQSFMDSVVYEPGQPPTKPNVLCLHKKKVSARKPLTSEDDTVERGSSPDLRIDES